MVCDSHTVRFAFYGRTARTDATETAAEQYWQQYCCRAAAAACGGQIISWFSHDACAARMALAGRPRGRELLAALDDPRSRVGALVATDAARLLPRQPGPGRQRPWRAGCGAGTAWRPW